MPSSTRQKTMNKLIANYFGWGRRIRTSPAGSRVRCPTARRSPKGWVLSSEDRIFRLQIQSLSSNPLHCLDSLCNQSITLLILKSQLLKYQPAKGDAAGTLFASPMRRRGYNIVADNGKETIPPAAPPTLRDIRRSADETDMVAPSTLSRPVTEVASC